MPYDAQAASKKGKSKQYNMYSSQKYTHCIL
jgi:hypothetical protein